TEVWVKAAGLIRMKAVPSWRAAWTRSTSACSALDWKASSACPASPARRARSASMSARVVWPYTSGSRVPSRLRLGPCRTSSLAMVSSGTGKGGSLEDAAFTVQFDEDEGVSIDRLKVMRVQLRAGDPRIDGTGLERAQVLAGDPPPRINHDGIRKQAAGVAQDHAGVGGAGGVEQDRIGHRDVAEEGAYRVGIVQGQAD